MRVNKTLVVLVSILLLPFVGITGGIQILADSSITALRFIDEFEIPYNKQFKGTTVGGLSGIDYDPKSKMYYLLSDDRSAINPARFYTCKIHFSGHKIDSIQFLDVHPMLQLDGHPFPSGKTNVALTPDPEAIRFDASTNQLVWVSEGERIVNDRKKVLTDPSINIIQTDGSYLGLFTLPENLKMQSDEKGPRQNGSLEGIAFEKDFKTMYASLEEPIYEDGPRADTKETNSWSRIYKFNVSTKQNTEQYAYRLDPVAYPSFPDNAFKVNGISEILSVSQNQMMVIERSFSTGRLGCTVKVFLGDMSNAENVIDIASLKKNPPTNPIKKKLLLNMDDLGIYIDNVEGVTFGPDLPNGHKTIIFVTDNNFLSIEKTQILLFEILP